MDDYERILQDENGKIVMEDAIINYYIVNKRLR